MGEPPPPASLHVVLENDPAIVVNYQYELPTVEQVRATGAARGYFLLNDSTPRVRRYSWRRSARWR